MTVESTSPKVKDERFPCGGRAETEKSAPVMASECRGSKTTVSSKAKAVVDFVEAKRNSRGVLQSGWQPDEFLPCVEALILGPTGGSDLSLKFASLGARTVTDASSPIHSGQRRSSPERV